MIFTGEQIPMVRLLALKGALKLEILGIKRGRRSAYSIIKQQYGLKGSKQKVLKQLEDLIEVQYGQK